jgi:hypothetical protein
MAELIKTSGNQIIKYFRNFTITQVFSACHRAITLQAAHIGEPAQPIEVQEFKPQARAVQAVQTTIQVSLKLSRVETMAILYGTLSMKTDSTADHIVNINKSKLSLQFVISTNLSANKRITQLCSNAQTTINKPAKKKSVA